MTICRMLYGVSLRVRLKWPGLLNRNDNTFYGTSSVRLCVILYLSALASIRSFINVGGEGSLPLYYEKLNEKLR
jgi:hypothetical protein